MTDANLLVPVLVLPDGWRAWRLAGDALRPGAPRVRSVIDAAFPRSLAGQRGGLLTRPGGLVAAGVCSVPRDGRRRLQGALPEPARDHGTRAWIWPSSADTPFAEAFADLLDRARAGLCADQIPALWSHHARLAHAARIADLLPAVADAEPLWNAP